MESCEWECWIPSHTAKCKLHHHSITIWFVALRQELPTKILFHY